MQSKVINGNAHATLLYESIKSEISRLKCSPKLAIVLVGNQSASEVYVKIKTRRAVEVGIEAVVHRFDTSISTSELLLFIDSLNNDQSIHGILVQMPLPAHVDKIKILNAINTEKDVDGFSPISVGNLYTQNPTFIPCTPLGIIHLIKSVKSDLTGLRATVIGRSNIVGRPVAELLLQNNCTVNIIHSKSHSIADECARSDIIVAAVGIPKFVNRNFIKPGAIVIDVGINKINNQIVGDIDYDDVIDLVSHITPVPGGVGPMTVAYLLSNTLTAAKLQNESREASE